MAGLLDNPELQQILQQLAASPEDRQAANKQALALFGLQLMQGRKGQELAAFGNAGTNALLYRQQALGSIPQQRAQELGGAAKLMQLSQQMQQDKALRDLAQRSQVPGLPQMGPPTQAGAMQPAVPPSFDKQAYGAGLWPINPDKAMAFEQAQARESPFAKVDPSKFTQQSVMRFAQSGNPGDLVPLEAQTVGKLNPSDFTPQSVATYSRSGNYADLVPIDKRPQTNVSVRNFAESEYDKQIGKSNAETYVAYQTAGRNADSTITKLNAMDKLLKGVDTSSLTPIGMTVSGMARGLGVDLDPKLPAKQAAEAIANEMALQSRQGGQMPGAMSDKDREFLQAMNPNLGQTPEGRALLIETRKKVAQREKEVAKAAREYAAKNGGRLDSGFDTALAAYAAANPLFAGNEAAAAAPARVIRYDKSGRRVQ